MQAQPQDSAAHDVDKILRHHVWTAMGVGLVPVPLLDIPALIGVQLNLLRRLSNVYGIPFSRDAVKTLLTSLVGGAFPVMATPVVVTSIAKIVPGFGQTAGIFTMSAIAGASTYAIGKVFIQHFASGGTFLTFDPDKVREHYAAMLKEGQQVVRDIRREEPVPPETATSELPVAASAPPAQTIRPQATPQQPAYQPNTEEASDMEHHKTDEHVDEHVDMPPDADQPEEDAQVPPEPKITNLFLKILIGDITVFSVIILNSLVILLTEVPSTKHFVFGIFPYAAATLETLLPRIDDVCAWYFILEFVIKAAVFSFPVYWRSWWNRLDFTVVVATLPLVISRLIQANLETLSYFSILRLGRFLRFFRVARALRMMLVFRTLWKGFTAIQLPIITGLIILGIRLGIMTVLEQYEGIIFLVNRGFIFLLTMNIGWLLIRFLNAVYEEYLLPLAAKTTTAIDDLIWPFAQSIIRTLLWSLTVIAALKNAGYDVNALLAALGLAGLAFAFAAKDLLANILGGLNILINRPFKMGDHIQVPGFDGRVTKIGLGTTQISDFSGKLIDLPNKNFTEGYVINVEAEKCDYTQVTLRLRHDTTADAVESVLELLKGLCRELEHIDDVCWASFDAIGEYSLDVDFRYGIAKYDSKSEHSIFDNEYAKIARMKTRMNLAIMHAFEEYGIKLALPIETQKNASDLSDNGLF